MTLVRLGVAALLVASGVVVLCGLVFDRTGQNIAFTVAGLAVFGVLSAFVAAWFLFASLRAARQGRALRAIVGAFVGGLFCVGSSMALAAAAIFALLTLTV